jgi:hypothetical protein
VCVGGGVGGRRVCTYLFVYKKAPVVGEGEGGGVVTKKVTLIRLAEAGAVANATGTVATGTRETAKPGTSTVGTVHVYNVVLYSTRYVALLL